MAEHKKIEGCECCGDWPVILTANCHPTAPLRVVMEEDGTLIFYCYIPECDRELERLKIERNLT